MVSAQILMAALWKAPGLSPRVFASQEEPSSSPSTLFASFVFAVSRCCVVRGDIDGLGCFVPWRVLWGAASRGRASGLGALGL